MICVDQLKLEYAREIGKTWKATKAEPNVDARSKESFVCGSDHLARQRYSREENTRAIEKLKGLHPRALLTVEDLAAVFEIAEMNEDRNTTDVNDWDQFAEYQNDTEGQVIFGCNANVPQIGQAFEMSAFLHEKGVKTPNCIKSMEMTSSPRLMRLYLMDFGPTLVLITPLS